MKTLKFFSSVLTLFIFLFTTSVGHAGTGYAIKPDLRVSQISTPGGLKKGSCSKIRVTITNPGMAPAKGTIPVILYVSQSGYPPKSYVGYLQGGLGPNSNYGKSVWFNNVEIASTGTVTLKAFVNPDHQIQESVYNNNTKIIKAKVSQYCGGSSTPVQGAKLEVTVYEEGTWQYGSYSAIQGAKITVTKNGQTYTGYSGNNGKYVFSSIPKGMVQIKVQKYGYQTVIQNYNMPTYYAKKNIGLQD